MALNTAERVSREVSDNFVYQRSRLAYVEAARRVEGRVLEIGTGSGYQTACLEALGAEVYSIERQKVLYDLTSALFKKLNVKVNNICGDGYLGMPEHAPFDKIIVTAGAFQFPPKLMAQLKVGGMMIIPVEDKSGVSNMYRVRRVDETHFDVDKLEECNFVPMLSGVNNAL